MTGVFADGLTLRFDGETESTEKRYKCNSFVVFKVNDRVRIIKDSGTYVVEYSVGNPKTSFNADTTESFTRRHTGSQLGFFGQSSYPHQGVSKVSANATLVQAVACLNKLVGALQSYGLI